MRKEFAEQLGQLRAEMGFRLASPRAKFRRSKNEMSPRSAYAVDEALGNLPLLDRIAALVCSVITRKPEAVKGTVAMIATATAMAKLLDGPERVALAEILRDSADEVEARREHVQV